MSGPDGDEPGAATADHELDRRRRRSLRRVVGSGLVVAVVLAVVAGAGGATGQAGAAIFLLVSALSCAVGAAVGVVAAVRDDLRGHQVSRARVVWVVGLFFAAAALMAMTAGAGG